MVFSTFLCSTIDELNKINGCLIDCMLNKVYAFLRISIFSEGKGLIIELGDLFPFKFKIPVTTFLLSFDV